MQVITKYDKILNLQMPSQGGLEGVNFYIVLLKNEAIIRKKLKGDNMEWVQFIIFFIGVFGLFIWNRAEARSDARHMDSKIDANRNLILEIHKETNALIQVIRDDAKDFHYRLLEIERNKK